MSIQFDGVDDYVAIRNVDKINTLTAFTCTLYVQFSAMASTQIFVSKTANGAAPFVFEFQSTPTGGLTAVWDNAGTFGTATSANGSVTTGVNYHLAAVFNGVGATNDEKWKVYRDGTDLGALTFAGAAPIGTLSTASANSVVLGARNGTSGFLTGFVQELRIWNIALPAQAIKNDILRRTPEYPEHVIAWAPVTSKTDTTKYTPLDTTVDYQNSAADGGDITTKTVGIDPATMFQRPSPRWRPRRAFSTNNIRYYPLMTRGA